MSANFGISHLLEYFQEMDLKIAQVDREREVIELAFHGTYGQWRMVVGLQQTGDGRKLMLVVPQVATITKKKRLECLEALMAVNYRIAIGKFGFDPEDGEVRLEETIPLADNHLTYTQFQLIFGAIMQTIAIYHNLLPRIIHTNSPILETIQSCEQDFFKETDETAQTTGGVPILSGLLKQTENNDEEKELDVNDVLEEVKRLLRQGHD